MLNKRTLYGVCNVLAVPCEQKIKAMVCSYRNMKRICRCLLWKCGLLNKAFRQLFSLRCNSDKRNALQPLQTGRCCCRISSTGLSEYQCGSASSKAIAFCKPPIMRKLLMACRNDVTAGAGSQIADYACFNINFWFHLLPSMVKIYFFVAELPIACGSETPVVIC